MIKKTLYFLLFCISAHVNGNPTADSLQMIVALADDWTSTTGFLQRYERATPNDAWLPVGAKIPVSFGQNGLGWGIGLHDKGLRDSVVFKEDPRVIEGSKKSPVGVFALHKAFGTVTLSAEEKRNIKLSYTLATSHTWIVGDPKSKYYNRIEDDQLVEKDWVKPMSMKTWMDTYSLEFGVLIEHNYDQPIPDQGSCFCIHKHRTPGFPTLGCTAFAREQVREVVFWLDATKKPILVQFPLKTFNLLKNEWRLPDFTVL